MKKSLSGDCDYVWLEQPRVSKQQHNRKRKPRRPHKRNLPHPHRRNPPHNPNRRKRSRTRAEYNAYVGALQQTDASAKISGLEAFLTSTPTA